MPDFSVARVHGERRRCVGANATRRESARRPRKAAKAAWTFCARRLESRPALDSPISSSPGPCLGMATSAVEVPASWRRRRRKSRDRIASSGGQSPSKLQCLGEVTGLEQPLSERIGGDRRRLARSARCFPSRRLARLLGCQPAHRAHHAGVALRGDDGGVGHLQTSHAQSAGDRPSRLPIYDAGGRQHTAAPSLAATSPQRRAAIHSPAALATYLRSGPCDSRWYAPSTGWKVLSSDAAFS